MESSDVTINGASLANGDLFNGYTGEPIANIAQAQAISAGELLNTRFCFGLRLMRIRSDEIALYDRQIRLWGVKAQEK